MLRITCCCWKHLLAKAYQRKSRAVKYLPSEVAFLFPGSCQSLFLCFAISLVVEPTGCEHLCW